MRISSVNYNATYQNNNKINTNATKTIKDGSVNNSSVPSFQGVGSWIDKVFGQKYAAYLYKQEWFNKLANKLAHSKLPGDMTANMATLGALLTSGTYVARTINNKDLDPDKRRTLTVNQIINFIVPTICAYTVSNLLGDWVDTKKKIYSASYTRRGNMGLELGHMTKEEFDSFMAKKGKRLGGVKVLATLVTFTLIYRFITPVLMTPIANRIGEKINNKEAKKNAEASQPEIEKKPATV